MPKHIRENFVNAYQSLLDAGFEFMNMEPLTKAEKADVNRMRIAVMLEFGNAKKMVRDLEKRLDEIGTAIPKVPLPGPVFTWLEHDRQAKLNYKVAKKGLSAEALKRKLAELERELEALK